MPDGLWWLPSLIVFGTTALLVTGTVGVVRMRRQRTRGVRAADPDAELERRAGLALVRADDALRAAEDEVEFARAQFGDEAAREFHTAVLEARDRLRDAFRLRQRLHDEVPDTPSQRKHWNASILELCDRAVSLVAAHTTRFDERRALERSAPERSAELRAAVDATGARLADAQATVDRMRARYAPRTYVDVADAPRAAEAALDAARTALVEADDRAARGEPAAGTLDSATRALLDARQRLEAVDRTSAALDAASAELAAVIADIRLDLAHARVLRDSTELPETAAAVGRTIDDVTVVLQSVNGRGSVLANERPDPYAQLEGLRTAAGALDSALASARNQQQRVENARGALRGALFAARSHIEVAAGFIDAHRDRVGADARTRLEEARRQLTLAESADDPVEALDIARRASRIAQDADALARYDAGPRTAPLAR